MAYIQKKNYFDKIMLFYMISSFKTFFSQLLVLSSGRSSKA